MPQETVKPFGTPVPNSPHGVSVSMPAWQDVVDYEEGNARAKAHIRSGYPRFVYHPLILDLCAREAVRLKAPDCMVFPSLKVAEECVVYLARRQAAASIYPVAGSELFVVAHEKSSAPLVKEFWMHAGMIVSSRRAEAFLRALKPNAQGDAAKIAICQHIADLTGALADDVFLYPSGMAAIYAAHSAATALSPKQKTVQLGFPYVDTLKIQQKMAVGAHYLRYDHPSDFAALGALLQREKIAAVFSEYPTNPLLRVLDLQTLSQLCRAHGALLIIDDTVGTFANIDLIPYVDMVVTSLTKYFSGVGDVLAGSMIISAASPHVKVLRAWAAADYEDVLYADDAVVLEHNSRDFSARMRTINQTAHTLAWYLHAHPKVAEVFYPEYTGRALYDEQKRTGGGYGGLLSITLKDPRKAPAVYDTLNITKGPSLGTSYTLVCPYTLLAHYRELDFAAASGVTADLIRISVGCENPQDLIAIFATALENG